MTAKPTYPYSLEVSQARPGVFNWAIRERGRLLQRSDRYEPSERAAREKGEHALENLFAQTNQGRRT